MAMNIGSSGLQTFKLNRPIYQAKTGFVQSVLKHRDDLNTWMCQQQDKYMAKKYMRIVKNFMAANLRQKEIDTIMKKIPKWEDEEKKKYTVIDDDTDDLISFNVWQRVYAEANKYLDGFYNIRDNKISWGIIGRHGFTLQGKEVELVDIPAVEEESEKIEAETEKTAEDGVSIV